MTKDELIYYAEINKFSNYHEFYDWISEREDFKKFVEVGVWKGQGVVHLANALIDRGRDDFEIIAVDLFEDLWKYKDYEKKYEGYKVKDIHKMFEYNTRPVKDYITKVKGYSDKVADKYEDESIDFVFIDADHEQEQVRADILAWLPKVRKGGIISGHDYVASQQGVIKAVNSIWRKDRKFYKGYVWYRNID
ncbi:hypothetical protein LCGC14_2715710 [marine sediment metagenome]|uniref:Methyltransferase domain-containing protein n=1 Tax=marine sediment metagenome TaxID=412755 RepID=A0A0F8ZBM7_9ZZZZ